MHNEEGNHGSQSRYFLLGFCHTDGYAYREDNRQIAKDGAARCAHNCEQRMQHRAITEDGFEAVGLDGRRVGKRRTQA